MTNVPENSVIEFIAQSSVPLRCNCNNNCNDIEVIVPGWTPLSICGDITKSEYRDLKIQNPIQVQFHSTTVNIGNSFNLTYRGKPALAS